MPKSISLQVHMSPAGSGLSVDETVDLYCGDGEQILQWVGYAACARLAYSRGEAGSPLVTYAAHCLTDEHAMQSQNSRSVAGGLSTVTIGHFHP
jgi:hypothetical protein